MMANGCGKHFLRFDMGRELNFCRFVGFLAVFVVCGSMQGQAGPVTIRVDAGTSIGDYRPIWNYFGADEPNYTYAPNGTKLLRELSGIEPGVPVYFRTHNLLTSGDGSASLKWGSTGVYSEKPDGTPIYNWTITDRIFDNFKATGITPMVEIGFMPEALSPKPQPYRHSFPNGEIWTGWSYPPKDYAKWRALIVAWVTHLHERYGAAANTWLWEVWNEPDIPYFHGTEKDYEKLYDISTGAVRQVLPNAKVGGPAATGPYPHEDASKNSPFLRNFLEHCAHGVNADTGKPGVPLDFISFHPKGSPRFVEASGEVPAHVQMNLAPQMGATDLGMQIVASFPEFKNTPIILSESDPEGCAACKGPQMGYRNGPLYGVSVAEMLARSEELARKNGVNLQGAVTWAFEMMDQPWFAGFRELATNGVDKPVLGVFRMFGMLKGEQLSVTSSGAETIGEIEKRSVVGPPDLSAIATKVGRSVDVLVWNYEDEDLPAAPADVRLEVAGVGGSRVKVIEYRMDRDHSNAYTAWLQMGSPQAPTAAQIQELQKASELAVVRSTTTRTDGGTVKFGMALPRQGVSLVHLSW
jgi:xylan 1,4-beta-xylosidase